MKIYNLILLILFFFTGSQTVSPQSKKGDLPVIDFSKQYPKKEILLQDIAESEYIPLETTDDVLLGDRLVLLVFPTNIFLYMNLGEVIYLFSIETVKYILISTIKDKAAGNMHGLETPVQFWMKRMKKYLYVTNPFWFIR